MQQHYSPEPIVFEDDFVHLPDSEFFNLESEFWDEDEDFEEEEDYEETH